jgi:hypothetical protein
MLGNGKGDLPESEFFRAMNFRHQVTDFHGTS